MTMAPQPLDAGLLPATLALRASVPPERWETVVARAHERVRVLSEVARLHAGGVSLRGAVAAVAPDLHWATFLHWRRRANARSGQDWERQLDERVSPPQVGTPADVVASACALRRLKPSVTCAEVRKILVTQFGPERGKISDTTLKRIWKREGLAQPWGRRANLRPREKVTGLSGGAGIALLAAAAAETGVLEQLGQAVLAQGKALAASQTPPTASIADTEGRDDHGRFTRDYNQLVRGEADRDPRLDSDDVKRARRDLKSMNVLRSSPVVVGQKVFAMGLSPLLTERRGFDGLDGPAGSWLLAAGGPDYRSVTLDKTLSELALLETGAVLWDVHAEQWARVTAAWREGVDTPGWLRTILYVDATQDPYWTHTYAASGKVSRVNDVMPCLTRVAVMGGPGVPLIVETKAGAVSLKKELLPLLERMDRLLGDSELGRLTVVDSEMSSRALLRALSARGGRSFITVLKGSHAKGVELENAGVWQRYRTKDLLREGLVRIQDDEGTLELRGVEMTREGSRNPAVTLFVTNAPSEELTTAEVATAYLSRWPHQEQLFRDARNGAGLDRSHGYGGKKVAHVALTTAGEAAAARVARAETRVATKTAASVAANALMGAAPKAHRAAARASVTQAAREQRAAEKALAKARQVQQRLASTSREIYVRDTTRDNIATCAKLTALMLVEFVLKEYLGGARMEVRTFIERFVHLPVTIRETKREVIYEIAENPRSPNDTALLRAACETINRRNIKMNGRRMWFELRCGDDG